MARTSASRPLVSLWPWRLLALHWLLLLAVLTAFRIAFLVHYRAQFADVPWTAVAGAFASGLRFDAAIVSMLTGLQAVAIVLASPWAPGRWLARLEALWVALVAAGTVLLCGIDLYYYAFVGRRLGFEVTAMTHDWRPIVTMIATGYTLPAAGLTALLVALAVGVLWLSEREIRRAAPRPRWWSAALQAFVLLLAAVLVGRGGLQTKPLTVSAAFNGPRLVLGHLALNPVFTALNAARKQEHQRLAFYPEDEAVRITRGLLGAGPAPRDARYPLLHHVGARGDTRPAAGGADPGARLPNLVLIVLESFSPRFIAPLGGRPGVTPHLNALADEGILFTRFHAAGTRSVEGIGSLLTGYPALPDAPLLGSTLEQNALWSLPLLLRARGYHTLFLHGAFRGSMWFDRFAARHGFQRFIAKEDFADAEAKSDGAWGIYDHFALQRLHEELAASPRPTFALFFSLSSHTPFTLPPGVQPRFGPAAPDAAMLNAFAYTDSALGRFFEAARGSDYWDKTVFMVTADHNLGGPGLTLEQRMRIPLLILKPGDPDFPHGARVATLGSQLDVAPTALDLLGLSATASFGGHSLLAPRGPRYAMLAWGAQAGWLTDDGLLVHDLTRPLAYYDWRADPGLKHNLLGKNGDTGAPAEAVREFQSYYQAFNNVLLDNRAAPPDDPPPPVVVAPSAAAPHGAATAHRAEGERRGG